MILAFIESILLIVMMMAAIAGLLLETREYMYVSFAILCVVYLGECIRASKEQDDE